MPIREVFLPLVGEPDERMIAAIDKCVAVSGDLGARIFALAVEQDVPLRPQTIRPDLDNVETAEALRSATDARGLLGALICGAHGMLKVRRGRAIAATSVKTLPWG